MRQLIIHFFVLITLMRSLESKDVEISINLPDKSNYQSTSTGTDKHKYGYELKDNNHFHHTTTGKDGVRLGCYGYEIDGRKYLTQYVADTRGYRIIHSSQDLITVYPKSGSVKQAMMYRDGMNLDDENETQTQYVFPKGCKGIDVMIDNSSRLRALNAPVDHIARLPVTLKTTTQGSYVHSTPPSSYIPPGPSHIYSPDQIHAQQISKPSNAYIPPVKPSNAYLPPAKPSNAYLPPKETTSKPSNTYIPPKDTTKRPANTHIPPKDTTKRPAISYIPPVKPANSPSNAYIPPLMTQRPPINYLPPETTISSIANISNIYLPPDETTFKPQHPMINIDDLLPPFETVDDCCCDKGKGSSRLILPVPLKLKAGSEKRIYAKLVVPIKDLDVEGRRRISASITDEIDVAEMVKAILMEI